MLFSLASGVTFLHFSSRSSLLLFTVVVQMQHFRRFAPQSNPCHILPKVLPDRSVVASFFANFGALIKVQSFPK